MHVDTLTEQLKNTFGSTLNSVVLYGSAAAGDHTGKRSDYNVLVVVDQLGPSQLRHFSKTTRRWVKAGNPPPLFFTLDRLRASTDIFPIELMDIKETHRILHGQDMVNDLQIDPVHLRLELERELKSKLIQLRERYMISADSAKEVKELLIESLSTFLVLARAALRLWQDVVPPKKLDAAHALATHITFDPEIFTRIEGLKETGHLNQDPHQVFEAYLKTIETIVDAVDVHLATQKEPS